MFPKGATQSAAVSASVVEQRRKGGVRMALRRGWAVGLQHDRRHLRSSVTEASLVRPMKGT
jgi:hypothetical protein